MESEECFLVVVEEDGKQRIVARAHSPGAAFAKSDELAEGIVPRRGQSVLVMVFNCRRIGRTEITRATV